MSNHQFTVLIGSYARGTASEDSDVDIVRIGHRRSLHKKYLARIGNPKAVISYIDYDLDSFKSLHKAGSLFIHHILTEGKLLEGNTTRWARLANTFTVTHDLHEEIAEQLNLCTWLARPTAFRHATLPLLSHIFKALKNAAIFSLAQRGIYVYDKRKALENAFESFSRREIELLLSANSAYERGADRSNELKVIRPAALVGLCRKVNAATKSMMKDGI